MYVNIEERCVTCWFSLPCEGNDNLRVELHKEFQLFVYISTSIVTGKVRTWLCQTIGKLQSFLSIQCLWNVFLNLLTLKEWTWTIYGPEVVTGSSIEAKPHPFWRSTTRNKHLPLLNTAVQHSVAGNDLPFNCQKLLRGQNTWLVETWDWGFMETQIFHESSLNYFKHKYAKDGHSSWGKRCWKYMMRAPIQLISVTWRRHV